MTNKQQYVIFPRNYETFIFCTFIVSLLRKAYEAFAPFARGILAFVMKKKVEAFKGYSLFSRRETRDEPGESKVPIDREHHAL